LRAFYAPVTRKGYFCPSWAKNRGCFEAVNFIYGQVGRFGDENEGKKSAQLGLLGGDRDARFFSW